MVTISQSGPPVVPKAMLLGLKTSTWCFKAKGVTQNYENAPRVKLGINHTLGQGVPKWQE